MTYEQLTDNRSVMDKEKPHYGVGQVEKTENELVYVWYDDIDTSVHYNSEEIQFLEPLEA